jgi:CheY-like chemotaxis protein
MPRSQQRPSRLATSGSTAAVAHELTNVLTVISGVAELLARETRLPAGARTKLDLIITRGRRGAELVRQLTGAATPSRARAVNPRPRPQKPTVLLVEDDEAVRAVIEWQLEALGCRVLSAASGEEALRVRDRHAQPLTFAVLDYVMPAMDGAELYRRLQQAQHDLPAIFLSGAAGKDRVRALADAPQKRVQWLPKPASLDQLATAVARALDQSGAGRK